MRNSLKIRGDPLQSAVIPIVVSGHSRPSCIERFVSEPLTADRVEYVVGGRAADLSVGALALIKSEILPPATL